MRYSSQKIGIDFATSPITATAKEVLLFSTVKTNFAPRKPNQCSKSTPPLAINYRKNKSSRMP
jgi:hypothetical protein